MTDTKISELGTLVSIDDDADEFVIIDDSVGETKKITVSGMSASETAKGIVELATDAEAIAGTDTTRAVTAEGLAAHSAVVKNPLAFAQGVHMTYAASGSNGIAVADDADIDFGTGNFTLRWKGSLPDWTPTATTYLGHHSDVTNGFQLYISGSSGLIRLYNTNNSTAYVSTAANTLADGSIAEIAVVVINGTSSTFYINGIQLGDTVTMAAGVFSSTNPFYVGGLSTIRNACTVIAATLFNRALTAAQVLSLYRNGVDFADQWGSQTELMPNQVDRDFSGASAWSNQSFDSYNETGDLSLTANASGQYCYLPVASMPTTIGKRHRLSFDLANHAGNFRIHSYDGAQIIAASQEFSDGSVSIEFIATTTGGLRIYSQSTDSSGDFDNFSLIEIGATLDLEPEGIQPSPGQWLDSSGNGNHAMQPAAGSSLVRPKKDFEYRWTNTWTASATAQYIGGVNQAVLSTKHFITNIISRATVTTDVENIEIGDGSAAAYYVAAVAPTAAPVDHTLAKNLNDGTNLKLVVTPAAEATMTVEFIVRGFLLE